MVQVKRSIVRVIAVFVFLVAFLVLATTTYVWASGLKYDPVSHTFQKTALIAIDADLRDVQISLNGVQKAQNAPVQFKSLNSGRYTVDIKKTGFQSWSKVFDLNVGEVGLVEGVNLIAVKPKVEVTNNQYNFTDRPKFDVGLSYLDGELIDNGNLVTRFSSELTQAHRFNGGYLYQVGNEVRIYFGDGPQDNLVFQTASSLYQPIYPDPGNWQIVISDNNQNKLISLTTPTAS